MVGVCTWGDVADHERVASKWFISCVEGFIDGARILHPFPALGYPYSCTHGWCQKRGRYGSKAACTHPGPPFCSPCSPSTDKQGHDGGCIHNDGLLPNDHRGSGCPVQQHFTRLEGKGAYNCSFVHLGLMRDVIKGGRGR